MSAIKSFQFAIYSSRKDRKVLKPADIYWFNRNRAWYQRKQRSDRFVFPMVAETPNIYPEFFSNENESGLISEFDGNPHVNSSRYIAHIKLRYFMITNKGMTLKKERVCSQLYCLQKKSH